MAIAFRKLSTALFLYLIACSTPGVSQAASELIYTAPLDTTLALPGLQDASSLWPKLFDSALSSIDLGQMYAISEKGEPLDASIDALARAGKRGVKIRFLIEKKMLRASSEDTIKRLQAIENLELRVIDFGKLSNDGIHHAKYILVDGKTAFVGSHNFDWRALKHIHELGVLLDDPKIVSQIQSIFEHDWNEIPSPVRYARPKADTESAAYLVASPWRLNPDGVGDSEEELVRLLSQAKQEVMIQVMDYYPLNQKRDTYYAVIDNALRAAAVRGVKIKLLVSNWNTGKKEIPFLKSLSLIPNVEIRIVSIPEAKQGFIPFARVIHSKYMIIDRGLLWIGTSNWGGGYLDNSRNLELIFKEPGMIAPAIQLHEQLWGSPYSAPIDVNREYIPPRKS